MPELPENAALERNHPPVLPRRVPPLPSLAIPFHLPKVILKVYRVQRSASIDRLCSAFDWERTCGPTVGESPACGDADPPEARFIATVAEHDQDLCFHARRPLAESRRTPGRLGQLETGAYTDDEYSKDQAVMTTAPPPFAQNKSSVNGALHARPFTKKLPRRGLFRKQTGRKIPLTQIGEDDDDVLAGVFRLPGQL